MSNLKYWVWLSSVRGLRAAGSARLLERFGGPREVFFAPYTEFEQLGLKPAEVEALRARDLEPAERILEDCAEKEIQILTLQDSAYPERLRNITAPPVILYMKGRLPVIDEEAAVAVVGARQATPYGQMTAEKFGTQIVEHGGIVISGMARGVDSHGHLGALRAGGVTVAVLGSGVDVVYPPENGRLYEDIIATGAVISEYPPGTAPHSRNFPERNRIISGLSVATVVIEAARSSGSLRTVAHALEQGREVFAVPGNVDAPNSEGCNELIREGAMPATCGWDILRDFVPLFPQKLSAHPRRWNHPAAAVPPRPVAETLAGAKKDGLKKKVGTVDLDSLSQDERCIYELLLEGDEMQVDDLVEAAQIPTNRVLSALTLLELNGAVRQRPNKKFSAWAEQN